MDFKDIVTADVRLVLLRTLNETAGFSCNESILHAILAKFGHNISRDRVRTDLVWLSEQALLSLDDVAGIYVATITQRGVDVATGAATVPGVKRPSPRS
jgi:hypothetical protein